MTTYRVLGRSGPIGRGLPHDGAEALAAVAGDCVVVADEPRPGVACVVCAEPRRPERSRKYAGHEAETDPFCSTGCARRFHGTSLPVRPTGPAAA